jgi:hypothetical protein
VVKLIEGGSQLFMPSIHERSKLHAIKLAATVPVVEA